MNTSDRKEVRSVWIEEGANEEGMVEAFKELIEEHSLRRVMEAMQEAVEEKANEALTVEDEAAYSVAAAHLDEIVETAKDSGE